MYGLILEGGGARGAYHMGAYKAIVEEGFEIAGLAGTSIGALNGAMILQGDHETAYEMWHNISYSQIVDADDEIIEKIKQFKLDKENIFYLVEMIKETLSEKGLDITPLKEMMMEYINEAKIRESGKDFGLVTISVTDFKPLEIYIEDIPQGKLREYILASAYLPIFKTEKLNGKIYLDGGLYNNLPVNLLTDKGYKNIIIVKTKPSEVNKKIKLDNLNTSVISPKEELSKTINFTRDAVRYNLKLGYYDALKTFKKLKGYHYYIEPVKDKDYFIKHLLSLKEEKIRQLEKIFYLDEKIPYQRSLFERIIPKLSKFLNTGKTADYDYIFYCLLERLASIYGIEKLNLYTYEELLNIVKDHLSLEKSKEVDSLEDVVESLDFLSLFHKEELLKKVGKIIL